MIRMAGKKRMVHDRIWDCDQFVGLNTRERLLFLALITGADDEGCFRADPKFWKRRVFYDDRIGIKRVSVMLESICDTGLIVLGETSKGQVGAHPNWHQYQSLRADRSKPSEYFELLVANGLPMRFTQVTQGNTSEENKRQVNLVEDRRMQERVGRSPRELMIEGLNKPDMAMFRPRNNNE